MSATAFRMPVKGITLGGAISSGSSFFSIARSTSAFVIFPSSPVPVMEAISRPACLAISMARGVIFGGGGPSSWYFRTSVSVTRPPGPDPGNKAQVYSQFLCKPSCHGARRNKTFGRFLFRLFCRMRRPWRGRLLRLPPSGFLQSVPPALPVR